MQIPLPKSAHKVKWCAMCIVQDPQFCTNPDKLCFAKLAGFTYYDIIMIQNIHLSQIFVIQFFHFPISKIQMICILYILVGKGQQASKDDNPILSSYLPTAQCSPTLTFKFLINSHNYICNMFCFVLQILNLSEGVGGGGVAW